MCFYNDDYDWYASVQTVETHIAGTVLQCVECGREIAVGESHRYVYQQEHEECQVCYVEGAEPCEDGEHDYGETYRYRCCDQCRQLLEVIQLVEIEEGCPPHAQQPRLEELGEVFRYHESAETYAKRAVEMFPALASHPFILNMKELDHA